MKVVTVVEYKHLFGDTRPDAKELLKNISSRDVIAVMSMINDVLSIRRNTKATQAFLMHSLASDFPEEVRNTVLVKAGVKLNNGYEIFNFPYTVEVINRELINFRAEEVSNIEKRTDHTLAIFKAYLATVEELTERDSIKLQTATENAKKGGNNIIQLMWPHLMSQYQFTNRPYPKYEINRGLALLSYLDRHSRFGSYAKKYFESNRCSSYQDYFLALLSLLLPHLQREPSTNLIDYFYTITTEHPEPVLESMVATPSQIAGDPKKQINYLGLKEKPILCFEKGQYIVPYWDFLINALFTGIVFSFYYNSGVNNEFEDLHNSTDESGFGKFKGIIGKEFSEGVLFRNTMIKCFSRKYESLEFFDDNEDFNPDCYYRQGNNIFIFEFKDYMLNSDIIQSGSYEIIKSEIDKKFVSETIEKNGKTKVKEKGVLQLARNIEKLAAQEDLFWKIDSQAKVKKLKLRNMNIYPIIVQTSIYFDFPGVNDYLENILRKRLTNVSMNFKNIRRFTMIDFRYFEDRLLLFSDSKIQLSDELHFYQQKLIRMRRRANLTHDVNDNFAAMAPFSHINSPAFKKQYGYRLPDLREVTEQCWNFKLNTDISIVR